MRFYSYIRPFIFSLPEEMAHNLAISVLGRQFLPGSNVTPAAGMAQKLWGIDFAHPVGLAAGFDKNAAAVAGLLGQGFAFVEAGTVTPRPQPGNPKPRLFRLAEDEAVINRMGFNNLGVEVFHNNIVRFRKHHNGIVGINIGRNKDGDASDYKILAAKLGGLADYITVNISSPNTPGLRDMQKPEVLDELIAELQTELAGKVPLLVKLAPDLGDSEMAAIADVLLKRKISGVILTNTTISRPDSLRSNNKGESGGLSGRPLRELANERLARFYQLTGGQIKLIGAGGIASAEDAYARIRAGASLVQIYSALVYKGFDMVREIVDGLPALLQRDGFANIGEAVGAGNN